MRDDSAEIPFQSFLQEAIGSSSGTDKDVHALPSSIQHFQFPPSIMASPTLQGALTDGLGEVPAPTLFFVRYLQCKGLLL